MVVAIDKDRAQRYDNLQGAQEVCTTDEEIDRPWYSSVVFVLLYFAHEEISELDNELSDNVGVKA